MILVLILIFSSATVAIRRANYELFSYIHQIGMICFFICFFLHGAGCFVVDRSGQCYPYYSWAYALVSFVIILTERIAREIRGSWTTTLTRAIIHPSNTIELQFVKPSLKYLPGQYILLNIPQISNFEWHPFSITSCSEQDYTSIHIQVVGNWTRKLSELTSNPTNLSSIELKIDGAFGSPTRSYNSFKSIVLISGGVGVTVTASILKSILFQYINTNFIPDVTLIWACRDRNCFEWFQELLNEIESIIPYNLLKLNIFYTGVCDLDEIYNITLNRLEKKDVVLGLNSKCQFGRPNYDVILASIADQEAKAGLLTRVGVFVCGNKGMARAVEKSCKGKSTQMVKFVVKKEEF